MKTRTKIIFGIMTLILIGSFGRKDSKSAEIPSNTRQTKVVIDEYEQNV